jgi:hypothetical protein
MSVQIEHSRTGGAGLGMTLQRRRQRRISPNLTSMRGVTAVRKRCKNVYPLSPKLRGLLSFALLVSADHTVSDDHSLVTCAFKTRSITWHHLRQAPSSTSISPQSGNTMQSSSMDTQEEEAARPITPGGGSQAAQPTNATPIRHRGESSAAVSSSKWSTISKIKCVSRS